MPRTEINSGVVYSVCCLHLNASSKLLRILLAPIAPILPSEERSESSCKWPWHQVWEQVTDWVPGLLLIRVSTWLNWVLTSRKKIPLGITATQQGTIVALTSFSIYITSSSCLRCMHQYLLKQTLLPCVC